MKTFQKFINFRAIFWFGLCIALSATITNAAAAAQRVNIGLPSWAGVTIKSQIVAQILQPLGYEVKFTKASAPIIDLSMARGDIDIYLGAWSPGQKPTFGKYVKSGQIKKVATNLPNGVAGFAVPNYVYASGLHSNTQLPQFASRFNRKINCIEKGSGQNKVVKRAIKNNTYGLHNWTMAHSSTAAMLAQVKHAIDQRKWILFCGWRPHWMNIALKMKYLEDPKNVFGLNGGHNKVFTLASADFVKNNPNLIKFFRNFQISSDTQSRWIYEVNVKKKPHKQVADQWISTHIDQVSSWLKGVNTSNGKNAVAALRTRYKEG